jgi:hypothetical protein
MGLSDVHTEIIEPQHDQPLALSYGEEFAPKSHRDFLEWIRTPRVGRAVHSNGFLSFGGVVTPAYECECGFRGMFESETCVRCGKPTKGVS